MQQSAISQGGAWYFNLKEDGMRVRLGLPILATLMFLGLLGLVPATASVDRVILAEDFTATW